METNQNKKLIEQLFTEGFSGKNPSVIDQVIAPNFVNHGIENVKPGLEGFKAIIKEFKTAFPDLNGKMVSLISNGDLVAMRGYWTGTNQGPFMGKPSTGRYVCVDYIDIWRIENGKCVENWLTMDMAGIREQLGEPSKS